MFRSTVCIAALFTASMQGALAAQPTVVLEPSSAWHIDYDEEKCRLARQFGGEDNQHILFLDQSGPSETFGLTVGGAGFDNWRSSAKVSLRLGTLPERELAGFFVGDVAEYGSALIIAGMSLEPRKEKDDDETDEISDALPDIDPALAQSVDHIEFAQGKRVVRFATGNLGPAFEALNSCSQDLLSHWGLDLDQHRQAVSAPKWNNIMDIARELQRTYPRAALRSGDQGIVRMRLLIDESGAVTDCYIENATVAESLESPACSLMDRADFDSALDAEKRPMKSFYLTTIRYVLP